MSGAFRAKTTAEWLKELEAAGIPCGPVNSTAQAASDPQVAARDMIVEVEQPGAGTFKVVNSPFKFSRTPTHADGHAPALGEHTEDVLSSLLGLSNEGIRKLKEAHAI